MYVFPKLAILVALLKLCTSLTIFDGKSYTVRTVRDIAYGSPIGTFTVYRKLECFIQCSRNDECRSLLYDKVSKRCVTNRVMVDASALACSGAGCLMLNEVNYAWKNVQDSSCASQIMQPCLLAWTCTDISSDCLDFECKCIQGFRYDVTNCQCVEECENGYAETFHEIENSEFVGNDMMEVRGCTLDECKKFCLNAFFECLSVDYNRSGKGQCFLHKYTPSKRFDSGFDYLEVRSNPAYSVYVRVCL